VKPKIFIAAPLFNANQIDIIVGIESILDFYGFGFYSARLHSGSDKLTPEDRKDIRKWDPVFDSNEQGLNECSVCVAVLEYAMSEDECLGIVSSTEGGLDYKPVELPDAGTVWETGYMRAQGKLVIGFHTTKRASHLNLMLSHGCDGLICGLHNLDHFFHGLGGREIPARLQSRLSLMSNSGRAARAQYAAHDASYFNWDAVEDWDAMKKDVE